MEVESAALARLIEPQLPHLWKIQQVEIDQNFPLKLCLHVKESVTKTLHCNIYIKIKPLQWPVTITSTVTFDDFSSVNVADNTNVHLFKGTTPRFYTKCSVLV